MVCLGNLLDPSGEVPYNDRRSRHYRSARVSDPSSERPG